MKAIMKAKIIVTLYIKNVAGALYTVNYNGICGYMCSHCNCKLYSCGADV